MKIKCIITGKVTYITEEVMEKRSKKFNSRDELVELYVHSSAVKLIRKGYDINTIRNLMNITEDLGEIDEDTLNRLRIVYNSKVNNIKGVESPDASLLTYDKSDPKVIAFIESCR